LGSTKPPEAGGLQVARWVKLGAQGLGEGAEVFNEKIYLFLAMS
jgi:hypothetical protein